ncbi:nucleotide sugar dehydrogenase [Marinicella sp. W31]|uniref:nucleotide sugar dehydrogenase n=1 Tax=Marinicella sp. W31 TaxID=3023713 RepID=UPI003758392F
MPSKPLQKPKIAVIGLGYVGLPLAVAFSRYYPTIGYDINSARVDELNQHHDSTVEVSTEVLQNADNLTLSDALQSIAEANIYIVTVPTPIDSNNLPDLAPLMHATRDVGGLLKKNDVVVFESTVYPGATEELCAPELEKLSGLQLNQDFYVGYSPERINPGDKVHTLDSIVKVVSASHPRIADQLQEIYAKVVSAGVFVAKSIRVAEAAKAIENTQRDVNIAFMNELAMMFDAMDIDTLDVIETAATKWNFLPFSPGLVGGHCIGVDPYYLIHKAHECGYFPELIKNARRLNEHMSSYVCERVLKMLALHKINIVGAKVLVMGLTFKENCPDLRNTKVIEVVEQLQGYHADVCVYDPWVENHQHLSEKGIPMVTTPDGEFDLVLLAVAHRQFKEMGIANIRSCLKPEGLVFDLKGIFARADVDERL